MKKFTINCDFNGQMSPFTIFIGNPEPSHHPLFFQADWLTKAKNGTIPTQVMDAVAKLKTLAEENGVSFEELCVYALGSSQDEKEGGDTQENNTENTDSSTDQSSPPTTG